MYQGEKSYWMKHLDFILTDLLWMEAAHFAAILLRGGRAAPAGNCRMALVILFIFLLAAFFSGCYHGILRRDRWQELAEVGKQCLMNMSVICVYLFLTKEGDQYSRFVWVFMGVFSFGLIFTSHCLMKRLIRRRKRCFRESFSQMLVLTTHDHAEHDLKKLLQYSYYQNYCVKGIVIVDQDRRGETIEGVPVVGYREEDALDFVRQNVVDEIFLHFTDMYFLQENLMQYFRCMGIVVHICMAEPLSKASPKKVIETIGGFTVISDSISIASPIQLFLKRCMDIAGGITGMTITAILFVILAPIIYIQSPGPIFFCQTRVGKNGRRFKIYKFRSMYPDAEARKKELMKQNKMKGLMFKVDNDPRIIPIGKFIRASSLDEFPQFWNVLKGDMSLVGTRPPTEDEYIYYEDYHRRRLAIKPGITGMWQVSGRSDITDFEEVVALDSQYIENWNIGLDFKILLKTVAVVFARKGSE